MTVESSVSKTRRSPHKLPAPVLAKAQGGVINPAWSKVVVTVVPYPMMACGDEVLLRWHGLNNDGEPYRHEVRRFVTGRQVGRDVVFVVREPHLAELEGGSLELSYRVTGKQLTAGLVSDPLQLVIGDVPTHLLPPIANDAVGGSLDPKRVPEGTLVTVRPYSRMAAGDRIILIASRDSKPLWRDELDIEAHAVGRDVSFWIEHANIVPHLGHSLSLTYVVRRGHLVRRAESLSIHIGPLVRPALKAPVILEAHDGWLDVDALDDAATVVIDGVGLEAGELVWFRCHGTYSIIRDCSITEETAGQPVVFKVPAAYWRDQLDRPVYLSYQVERLDDVSQRSATETFQVRSGLPGGGKPRAE
ncbi:hypothetical protein [Pseudomonas sp. T1.Ur]|uniref:hypothetical protein n=1 Tax=Pseudomonas sp. T1.Ur TaxID=2928704 RepID=UPI00201E6791|nr:hypothetical protein [Pseudomonas sp. T1.Ur]MCL6701468.1 hypothetical protein [Pseudomonas sp. T1.Ur]